MYERRDDAVWLASSPDLKVWHNVQDEPVLKPGPEKYDNRKIAVNQVLSFHGRYYLYYHGLGNTDGNWTTNIATSTDLKTWKKYEQNPLLPVELNKSSAFAVLDGNKIRVYTMHPQVHVHFPKR
jgi:beta-1,2-mannobiose phosphorylase / 1,2-beta-oligomannan phosphorylase